MKMEYLRLLESDLERAYELYREQMHAVVDEALGWDEAFQRRGSLFGSGPSLFRA